MIHRGDSVGEEGRFDHPNSPRSRLTFKPYARSSSGLKALSGRRSCDFRRNPWHGHDRTRWDEAVEHTQEAMARDRRTAWRWMPPDCLAELKALEAEDDEMAQTSTTKRAKRTAA